MNRRKFLKSMLIGSIVAAINPFALVKEKEVITVAFNHNEAVRLMNKELDKILHKDVLAKYWAEELDRITIKHLGGI